MINSHLKCDYPCSDTNRDLTYPLIDIDPLKIILVMISEAPSSDKTNYFYKELSSPFFRTTMTAFKDAGISINNYNDLTNMGIYLTTAIKCSKQDYLVSSGTIKNCADLLDKELSQFPRIKAIMCMGDFSIRAINHIWKRKSGISPIPKGSTYKIRKDVHELNGIRFFPSYTQTGDSFNLEKSKRRMISEDIRNAISCLDDLTVFKNPLNQL